MSSSRRSPGDEIVLSYYDSLLRRDDIDLLRGPHWLNDDIIGFYFEYLHHKFAIAENKNGNKMLFVSPELTQLLKLTDSSDYPELLSSFDIKKCDYIFFPLNNCDSREEAGGTHWSLLVFSRKEKTFFHLDSCRGTNKSDAVLFVNEIITYLSDSEVKLSQETDCPQQENGSDCGLFTLCLTDAVLQHIETNDKVEGCNFSGVKSCVRTKREELLDLIEELKNSQETNKQ